MRVAVLGLGRMGRSIAGRLLAGGCQLAVWNRSPGRDTELVERGARRADSVEDAVRGAEVVVCSLAADEAVSEVLLPGGAPIAGLTGVVVDCSTVAPGTSRILAGRYPERFVASPIAGGPQAVESGQALLIVAGAPGAVDAAREVLDALCDNRRDAGPDVGAAAVIKLLNNFLLLAGLAALADVVAVAQASGFADDDLRDLLADVPVVAPGLSNRIEGLFTEDHAGWFSVDLGAKDLRLFGELAQGVGISPGLTDTVRARYEAASGIGLGDRDLTAVIETLRRPGRG
jgi:3-hydroxyisobutyrate dehydrogenase-like beta-hydroxyacid dehydrogenase